MKFYNPRWILRKYSVTNDRKYVRKTSSNLKKRDEHQRNQKKKKKKKKNYSFNAMVHHINIISRKITITDVIDYTMTRTVEVEPEREWRFVVALILTMRETKTRKSSLALECSFDNTLKDVTCDERRKESLGFSFFWKKNISRWKESVLMASYHYVCSSIRFLLLQYSFFSLFVYFDIFKFVL